MTTFLILFAVAVAWVAVAARAPVRPVLAVPAARATSAARAAAGRRSARCATGLKRRQRLGSRTVHRIRRQVAAHWRGPR